MKKAIHIFPVIFNLLIFSVVLGLVVSHSGLTSMMIYCEMMMEEMPMSGHRTSSDTDMEHCPMIGTSEEAPAKTDHCEMEMSICGCEFQTANSFATLIPTVKLHKPVLFSSGLPYTIKGLDISKPPPLPIYLSDSYSPPPLFLENEAFLI